MSGSGAWNGGSFPAYSLFLFIQVSFSVLNGRFCDVNWGCGSIDGADEPFPGLKINFILLSSGRTLECFSALSFQSRCHIWVCFFSNTWMSVHVLIRALHTSFSCLLLRTIPLVKSRRLLLVRCLLGSFLGWELGALVYSNWFMVLTPSLFCS